HNGILRNDKELAMQYHLPKTDIKTDTYVAVQLLERHSSLCFETIAEMCETVRGDFVFTILNDDNTLFIAKGNNPICLIHSKRLGLYIYSSTSEIMTESLKGTFLEGETFELVHLNGGDIISIDKHGNVKNYSFDFVDDFPFGYSVFGRRGFSWYDEDDDDDYLTEIYQMYGIDPDDLLMLRDVGYDDEDIEMMRESYDKRRKLMLKRLYEIGLSCFEPKGAFYMFPSIKSTGLSSDEFSTRLLKEEKVAVIPGSAFGAGGEGFVRMCYASSVANIETALDRMGRFLERL
ncbi:MAG: aminotransferase class I/II-fold pyridoxal phosphate-dependent enzyme, partial [Oscillospiraceae bacterium]|nr:aminotransferase class I/II-fold pyridoxal phosphate-dependent enzyme [Oscillospiraceae bacterium]